MTQEQIGGAEMIYRTTHGQTTDGEPCCIYCGVELDDETSTALPHYNDDESWAQLALYHDSSCEWIATRAHSR